MKPELPAPVPPADPFHHRFAVLVLEGQSLGDAYREAYQEAGRGLISPKRAAGRAQTLKNREDVATFIALSWNPQHAKEAKYRRNLTTTFAETMRKRLWK